MSFFTGKQTGRIVTPDLHVTCSTWSSAILLTIDGNTDGFDTRFEIGSDRRAVDNQQRILGGFYTQPGCRTEHHRTQIQRRSRTIRRNETFVELDDLDAGLNDHLLRGNRQTKPLCRRLHATGILLDTEKTHLAIRSAESLQTFEKLNTVMQTRCRHVHLNILVLRYDHLAPLAVRIGETNVVIRLAIVETERTPIRIFHIL